MSRCMASTPATHAHEDRSDDRESCAALGQPGVKGERDPERQGGQRVAEVVD